MIVSHRHRFIFIKTRKTASTSIEIALSQFCGPEDIITPIHPDDEAIRRSLEYPGPQNFLMPPSSYARSDWLRFIASGRRKRFVNHASAAYVESHVPSQVWRDYFTFSVERDPFDKAVSRYFWSTRDPRPSINEFLHNVPASVLSNWHLYTRNDHIHVDALVRFEHLDDDLRLIAERLSLPHELRLPRAKSGYRRDRRHYSCLLDSQARARVETVCAKEIAAFGYRWNDG